MLFSAFISQKRSNPNIITGSNSAKKKKKQIVEETPKLILLKHYDPIKSHRFYGDFVIPDKLWQFTQEDGLFSFQLYKDYKLLRQLHVLSNGVLLEFEDYNEKELSSINFIQSRLLSLGDKNAYELAIFLGKYAKLFEINPEESSKNIGSLIKANSLKEKSFQWMENLFETHKNDVVFIRGNQISIGKDFRTKFLGFNCKLMEWLSQEVSVFSDKFINDCLNIFKFKSFEDYTNIVKSSVYRESFPKILNTIAGEFLISVDVKVHFIMEERMFFHYIVFLKKNHDVRLLREIHLKQNETKAQKFKENEKGYIQSYSQLMKLYYLKNKGV